MEAGAGLLNDQMVEATMSQGRCMPVVSAALKTLQPKFLCLSKVGSFVLAMAVARFFKVRALLTSLPTQSLRESKQGFYSGEGIEKKLTSLALLNGVPPHALGVKTAIHARSVFKLVSEQ
jgi:hypothetical protein